MDIPLTMSQPDMIRTQMEVETFNKSLQKNGRDVGGTLGKDDFLKLLVVQLENQDPTSPLDDKEFISQMAQFSSLEQMTQMNTTLSNLIINNKINLSYSLLGKYVEVLDNRSGQVESGIVSEVSFGSGSPSISFDGLTYSVDDVTKVTIAE
jgi:flagellar basal-body rod modification protein FlgD